jgi:GNAT superfamily N-acetyltransferase
MLMTNITLREGNEKDFPAILSLINDLAAFENFSEKVTNTVEQMEKEKQLFYSIVAENKRKEIVGMAVYFFAYYTWVGKSLYVDDLIVEESWRRKGIGKALLRKIFAVAKEQNCKRVRWQVLNWNKNAINLYEKSGAMINNEWSNCDFDVQAIESFKL